MSLLFYFFFSTFFFVIVVPVSVYCSILNGLPFIRTMLFCFSPLNVVLIFLDIFFSSFLFRLQEVKFFTFENSENHCTERDPIAEVETRGCYSQQKQAYTVNILVPPTPPTDLTSSKIVRVSYHLSVCVEINCKNMDNLMAAFNVNKFEFVPFWFFSFVFSYSDRGFDWMFSYKSNNYNTNNNWLVSDSGSTTKLHKRIDSNCIRK